MIIHEELLWILDKKGSSLSNEEEYQQNIDFVHSLGKKCDCVGWSKLDMDDPEADSILDKIKEFCKTNGWTARGWYTRSYSDVTSGWYKLKTSYFNDSTLSDNVEVPEENGGTVSHAVIRAYHESSPSPKSRFDIIVPERFRNACIKHNVKGVDFCWIQDKGKYEAEQYFYIYPDVLVPRIACSRGMKKSDFLRIKALGGYLPKIASVFSELPVIGLPDCYLAKDMPLGGIAYAYYPSSNSYVGRNSILIHKDTAEMLIGENALSQKDLEPVPILDTSPKGYVVDRTCTKPMPTPEYIRESLIAYEKLKATHRPARKISEKDALKVIRTAKAERKEDFSKKLGKALAESLAGSEYRPILPYLQIADGGQLSDEYEMLSYEKSVEATKEFYSSIEKEELLCDKPTGIVISKCADGDTVLLLNSGEVIRFSHESPETVCEWETVASFFFHAITETE